MPIQPRHTPGKARPRAGHEFTDRVDFIDVFKTALLDGPRDRHRVLVYYGVGGIGKTTLRKELSRLTELLKPGTIQTVLDFDVPSYRDRDAALFVMRKALREEYKIPFTAYDIAYAIYWQKTHPHMPMTRDHVPMMEDGTLLADVIGGAGAIPFVSLIPKVTLLAIKAGGAVREWWTKRGHEELKDLPELEPNQIAERLPMHWATSLREYLAHKESPGTAPGFAERNRGSPAVIFLDTYEALWEAERAEATYHLRDDWVRELVAQLPEVLWVVCGREKLRWSEVDPDWAECLDQHLVGGLADVDARSLLASCGISDPGIQQVIFESSSGMPYYLDLAVDTWSAIKERQNREPVPTDFARTPRDVFIRFLRHLTQAETETLKVLSAPRFWDYALFARLVDEYHTGYPVTMFSDLCRFSFIHQGELPDTWAMHHVMRESLQQRQASDLNRRVHQFMFEHYSSQLEGIDIRSITDRRRIALDEAFYHGRIVLSAQALLQWLSRIAVVFDQGAEWKLLVPLYEETVALLRSAVASETDLASALNSLAGLYRTLGRYPESETAYREAIAIQERNQGIEESRNQAIESSCPDPRPPPPGPGPLAPDPRRRTQLAESLSGFGLLLSDLGRYQEAEPVERRALEIQEELLGPDHSDVAQTLNNLGTLYWYTARYDAAEPLLRRALAIHEQALGPESAAIAGRLNNLAMLYHSQGRYADAEPLYRRAIEINRKALGPDHPEMATSLNNLAGLYYCLGKLAEAEPLLRQALETNRKALGPDHPDVALSLSNLAGLLRDQGRFEDAEPLYRQAIAIYERTLGVEHPDVAKSLNSLATLLRTCKRYEEAEQLFRRALGLSEKSLGADHPEVARALNGLGHVCWDQGRFAEAEPRFRRALEINEKALGSDHPDVAEGIENMARVCSQMGNEAEAQGHAERAKAIRARASNAGGSEQEKAPSP
jgi:tetratricopeptide (TPR) repeat protein